MTVDDFYNRIHALFDARGSSAYGEGVSMSEHMRQAAELARKRECAPELVGAALLHDIGHLLMDDVADHGIPEHEKLGERFLASHCTPRVAAVARLHVDAKRYLVATESRYVSVLSRASIDSLREQGGPMTSTERAAFESLPYWKDAVLIRRFDDRAKRPDQLAPPLASFRDAIAATLG